MASRNQRREEARRALQKQLATRQDSSRRVRRRRVILSVILSAFVVVAAVIAIVVSLPNDGKAAAKSTSASASPTSSNPATTVHTPMPSRPASAATTRAPKATTGPCAYAETAATLGSGSAFDVGLPPDSRPTPSRTYHVVFNTNLGVVKADLLGSQAPCNVQSIAYLIQKRFYDDTACPRVANKDLFIVQCGDPVETGVGGPTYHVKDENLKTADYVVGSIVMANSGPNTNGSQFFFATADDRSALTKAYTVIGQVTSGLNLIQQVANGGNDGSNQAGGGRPNIDLIFKSVTVSAAR
jgi:peptidyl-prolyl cis-trans isomerase B (cyclophilin B)